MSPQKSWPDVESHATKRVTFGLLDAHPHRYSTPLVYQLGSHRFQMLLGRRPYESIRNDFHVPFAVARQVAPYTWDYSDPYHQALQSCLTRDPSQRAAASDVVERVGLVVALSEIRRQLLEVEERNLTGRIQIIGDIFEDGSGVRSRGICDGEGVCVRYSNNISASDGNGILDGQILNIKRHVRIWGRLVHRNIEAFRGWALNVEERRLRVGFISTWRESVAVRRYLQQNPSADRRVLVRGVAQGLFYLHSEGVVHANIHPDNVMIGNQGDPYLRGFDFSYDHRFEVPPYGYYDGLHHNGLQRFMPPELLDGSIRVPTQTSDVWAFGCVSDTH
ncbi:kinase-like domain-containing protein [Cantharellus anzutake]|uniref:kinase-like domain-containing protein n=1 Tax=Cantharellus anzutake TaxID=1750568 RepID=UPI0019071605|nr:kinase-like domain-containing protein [Cantharellus anzutake]KAF8328587.1 kinase-like domain-containing protein [Cantharellus anzutake]